MCSGVLPTGRVYDRLRIFSRANSHNNRAKTSLSQFQGPLIGAKLVGAISNPVPSAPDIHRCPSLYRLCHPVAIAVHANFVPSDSSSYPLHIGIAFPLPGLLAFLHLFVRRAHDCQVFLHVSR